MARPVNIPKRLKAWRKKYELTQVQAAQVIEKALGRKFPIGTYLTYESGRRVTRMNPDTREKILTVTSAPPQNGTEPVEAQ